MFSESLKISMSIKILELDEEYLFINTDFVSRRFYFSEKHNIQRY